MIEVEHLSKSFGSVQAVRDVSFTVSSGEILGFLGVNGAGKTTTMRMLTGFFPPSSGKARIAGLDIFGDHLAVRKKIGYLPENVPLYQDLTVKEYLTFVAEVKGVARKKRPDEVKGAMESCRIEDVKERFIHKLSKGYRQRVGLAQALVGDPDVLILDEPTIGLDPKQIHEIRKLIKGFAGKKTVILSTHILPEVSATCQKIAIINQGRVVAVDTPDNLARQVAGAGKVRLKVGGPLAEVQTLLESLPEVRQVTLEPDQGLLLAEADPADLPVLAAAIAQSCWPLFEMTPISATLEEVFIRLVTADEREEGHD